MSEIVCEWFLKTKDEILVLIQITKEGPNSYGFSEGVLPPGVEAVEPKDFESEEDAFTYVQENYIPGRRTKGWTIADLARRIAFDQDDYGDFHVEGQGFVENRWDIKVWRKGSMRDGYDRYAVADGQFHRVAVDTLASVNARREILEDLGVDPNVDPDMKEAILHLIEKWEAKRKQKV